MSSSKVSVELPDPLGRFVDAQVQSGRFSDAAAYLQHLVRREREAELARFRGLIQEGLDSGPARELTTADWADLRHRALQRDV